MVSKVKKLFVGGSLMAVLIYVLEQSSTQLFVRRQPIEIFLPDINVTGADCDALFNADPVQLESVKAFQAKNPKVPIEPEAYPLATRNCTKFIEARRYITRPINTEEADFGLAYSIMIFKDVEQFERLLRAIYRPQNIYCINVDSKSSLLIHEAVRSITGCFSNVFLLDHMYKVVHGEFSVLEPEIACMRELLKRNTRWKYFINLTGQEFPLKTNWQMVRILKIFNGANNMEGTIKRSNKDRTASAPSPPVNVTLTKGSVHIVATRAFVDFVINNETAVKFLDWVKGTKVPDETFFSSLNHSPQLSVPGSYIGEPETDTDKYHFLVRFKNWGNGPFNWPCHGKRVRGICIFSVGDLKLLASRPELFANKFHLDYEPLALDCMEQLHYRRLKKEIGTGRVTGLDSSFYASQKFVRNHV